MENRFTLEQKMKIIDLIMMEDDMYDAQSIGELSEAEYKNFLDLCPEFERQSEWAKSANGKMKKS